MPLIGTRGWGDERQRATDEFFKGMASSFSVLWLVGKSSLVPKMYKEVQGSVSVFWIMQWSQREEWGGGREEFPSHYPSLGGSIYKSHAWLRVCARFSCQTDQLTCLPHPARAHPSTQRFLTKAIMVWHFHGAQGDTGAVFRTHQVWEEAVNVDL